MNESSQRYILLDMGFSLFVVHIYGGEKMNQTFSDFEILMLTCLGLATIFFFFAALSWWITTRFFTEESK